MSYGTVVEGIFVKDGQYLSFTGSGDITLGNVVKLHSTGTVEVANLGDNPIGVAVSGNRFSRTATDNVVESGQKVTVCTRGVVNVYTDSSAILAGSVVKCGASGIAVLQSGSGSPLDTLGIALEANGSAAATIQVKLLKG